MKKTQNSKFESVINDQLQTITDGDKLSYATLLHQANSKKPKKSLSQVIDHINNSIDSPL